MRENYGGNKRRKEEARRKKQEDKRNKRLNKNHAAPAPVLEEGTETVPPPEGTPSL